MTQRIRSCSSNTNLDTVNCDAYQTRLLPRSKAPSRSNTRECSATQLKGYKKSKGRSVPKETSKSSVTSEVSKNRQPWANLLTSSRSVDSVTTFDGCDPLRTVHFLSKELSSKLQCASFGDPHVYDLILSMQHALNRVPAEVTSTPNLPLKQSQSEINNYDKEIPEKLLPEKSERGCQTIDRRHLEVNTAKLQLSCEQIEKSYNILRKEKEHVENLLRLECERVASFRKQNAVLQHENAAIARQRDELETKLKQYKQVDPNELKVRIEDLLRQRVELEHENIGLRHRLTTVDIEREKFVTLLGMRDRQINEILSEIDALQEIVREQLLELQKVPIVSSTSSVTTLLSDVET
uniref:Uncharacterized protein n=1 Tax=Photinus pyralis TaxID=7054 RepID=A0A1Y1LWY7_PHOPY